MTVSTKAAAVAASRMTRLSDALSVPGGGFSVNPLTGHDVRSGFAVAVHPEREQMIGDRVKPADLSTFAYRNSDLFGKGGTVFGGWRDPSSGLAYLDVSVVVFDRDKAAQLARQHRQVAYFDLSTGNAVRV